MLISNQSRVAKARRREDREVFFLFLRDLRALAPWRIAFFLLLSVLTPRTSARDQYCNPLDLLCADPFIYREQDTYYLYATSSDRGLLVWTSADLVNWQVKGFAFTRTDSTWSQRHFWAPELFKHKDKYYLHFTAMGQNKKRRIVLAQGESPLGPFQELKAPWFDPDKGTIDSHVFKDDDGKLYLYSVDLDRDDRKCFEIHARRLRDDLVAHSDYTFCISPSQDWEGKVVNEGPFVFKHGDTYVLTYSANGYFDPNYSVGLATSKSPLGPWTKQPDPILRRNKYVSGPGHHCFIDSPDHKELFIAYHTHQHLENPSGERQLAIDRVKLIDSLTPVSEQGSRGTPREEQDPDSSRPHAPRQTLTLKVDGPTTQPTTLPSGSLPLVHGQSDDFSDNDLNDRRWNIFNERSRRWSLKDGHLVILTEDGDVFEQRSDLHNLFLQYAPQQDFTVTTRVKISPAQGHESAFLTIWQNHNQFTKLAIVQTVKGLSFEVARELSGRYSFDLYPAPATGDYHLRITRRQDTYTYSVSPDGASWTNLATHQISLLNPRVGLGACSPESPRSIPASFDFLHFSH